ncbi:MAG: hypothetical protein FGF48_07705 [Candidatus Brockarchaeota archaeon]|nr:hypothetical protein [Candidatus Brockarchaeota archaeon]
MNRDALEACPCDLKLFEDCFEGFSREWIVKKWVSASYLGIDFCFEDLDAKVQNIERNNCFLEGFGRFWMEEGFFEKFLRLEDFKVFSNPAPEEFQKGLAESDLIVLLDFNSQLWAMLKREVPVEHLSKDVLLFRLQQHSSQRTALVVATRDLAESRRLLELLIEGKNVLDTHEVWKGWPFCASGRYMVTPLPRHPGKILADALRMGCKWVFLVGPGEDLTVRELSSKIEELGLDFTVFSGQLTGDGKCLMLNWKEYPDPQSSDAVDASRMKKPGEMLFGVFNNLLDSDVDVLENHLDGYVFHEGNSEYLEKMGRPFLIMPHSLEWGEAFPSMWLFVDKGDQGSSSAERVVKAILSRKAVGVFEDGKTVGPSTLVNLLRILIADKQHLRKVFGACFSLSSELDGTCLKVSIENRTDEPLEGVLKVKASCGIVVDQRSSIVVRLEKGEKRNVVLDVSVSEELNGDYGLLLVEYSAKEGCWRSLCFLEVPPMVSTFPLLISEGKVEIPVSIWNNTGAEKTDLKISVSSKRGMFLEESLGIQAPLRRPYKTVVPLDLNAGDYLVNVFLSSARTTCRLLVRRFEGKAIAYAGDFDRDGLEEAVLENEHVVAKVISPGGRLLQYRLKKREADLLFKLYPKKPEDWRVSGRKRRFYPFGGLEEFIQQPTVEGHENFDIRIVKSEGNSAIVSAEADMNGNVLKKTFKLFAGTPLLEVRYEADFVNPELNVIGVNPLIRLGNNVDASHVIYYPSDNGIRRERYRGRLYGKRLFLKEDWIACYDEQEELGLIMAYDAKTPFLTHIWMNTPDNGESHYSYIEVQPWIRVNTGTTTYFTYYLYGFKGNFEAALKTLKETLCID